MTVNEYFKKLISAVSLGLEDEERELIQEKQNLLREKMREELTLADDFLTGSYPRNTIIKPSGKEKFDVDIFVAFSNEDYGESELGDLRKLVVNALNTIKDSCSELGITNVNDTQRRSVCVEFDDNFQIDVVPSIEVTANKLYKIFDKKTLKAVKSNPKLHGEQLSSANKRTGEMLVPIIKTLKSWKRDKCDYVKSFHLELLAVDILGGGEISSYSQGMGKFFNEAQSKLQKAYLKDPANDEYLIDAYLDDDKKRQQLINLVTSENKVAKEALYLEENSENNKAIEAWKGIFEDPDLDTAKAVRDSSFYATGGSVMATSGNVSNERKVDAPRAWKK